MNINPGPNYVNDYLNLQTWVQENKNYSENNKKPHLYSFVDYVYKSMVSENKDQVVNMLGQIGSGKTFNLVHILEYLCYISGPNDRQQETFEIIHKSIQLIHILGSILRENNMESTSCGMLLKLAFSEDNKICGFDLEAKILDFTLPFSENGRSFSILHALMTGASSEIKKLLELPEGETYMNFFRKFTNNFDEKIKDRFRLNDLEIWTRFHSLLNTFKFSKNEVLELLQLLSFVLLLNEAAIGKKKVGKQLKNEEFGINKGQSSKKLSKILNIDEDEFLKRFGTYKELQDCKNALIIMMKYSYYMVFDYVKNKVKSYIKSYFENMTGIQIKDINTSGVNQSFSNTNTQNIKNIYFLDFPGEVNDQTLGGLSTNLANECLNLFAGSQYLSVVEKLEEEKLNMKYFQPLHSFNVIEAILGKNGILKFLSKPYSEENFNELKTKVKNKVFYQKTTEFNENISNSSSEYLFNFKFSHTRIVYNYDSLYRESKSLLLTPKVIKLFEGSKNMVIKTISKKVFEQNKNIHTFTTQIIKSLFRPIEGLSPFVIYCLHSNNSLKIFFGENSLEKKKNGLFLSV